MLSPSLSQHVHGPHIVAVNLEHHKVRTCGVNYVTMNELEGWHKGPFITGLNR